MDENAPTKAGMYTAVSDTGGKLLVYVVGEPPFLRIGMVIECTNNTVYLAGMYQRKFNWGKKIIIPGDESDESAEMSHEEDGEKDISDLPVVTSINIEIGYRCAELTFTDDEGKTDKWRFDKRKTIRELIDVLRTAANIAF